MGNASDHARICRGDLSFFGVAAARDGLRKNHCVGFPCRDWSIRCRHPRLAPKASGLTIGSRLIPKTLTHIAAGSSLLSRSCWSESFLCSLSSKRVGALVDAPMTSVRCSSVHRWLALTPTNSFNCGSQVRSSQSCEEVQGHRPSSPGQ
jgi:hypothetical protein